MKLTILLLAMAVPAGLATAQGVPDVDCLAESLTGPGTLGDEKDVLAYSCAVFDADRVSQFADRLSEQPKERAVRLVASQYDMETQQVHYRVTDFVDTRPAKLVAYEFPADFVDAPTQSKRAATSCKASVPLSESEAGELRQRLDTQRAVQEPDYVGPVRTVEQPDGSTAIAVTSDAGRYVTSMTQGGQTTISVRASGVDDQTTAFAQYMDHHPLLDDTANWSCGLEPDSLGARETG